MPKGLRALLVVAAMSCAIANPATAGIIAVKYSDGDPGTALGGYDMTPFDHDDRVGEWVNSVASPLYGNVLIMAQGAETPLDMLVGDPTANNPDWWEYDDHGSVYMTSVHWIELLMPANTRAFSFYVGASFNGYGWIEGYDDQGYSTWEPFNVSAGNSPGFGVYSGAGSCSSITKIIVEPYQLWGVGNFGINQDTCTTVPEPGSLSLLGLGLLLFGIARRFRMV